MSMDEIQGDRSLITKTMGRYMPFSVDKKPLNQKIVLNGGKTGLHYRSYDPITDFDSKVLHIISKMCMDAKLGENNENFVDMIKVHKKYDETPFYAVTLLLHGFARYIDPQSKDRLQYRERIFDSLLRLSGVKIFVHDDMNPKKLFKRPTGAMAWINGVSLAGDYNKYEEVDLWISRDLMVALTEGISFNLKNSLQHKGRAYFLYNFMQTYKYKMNGGKYAYQNYIPHDKIVVALNLEKIISRNHNTIIKKAFTEIGLNYEYEKPFGKDPRWKKLKTKRI